MTVSILEVTFNYAGNEDVLYPVVLHHQNELVLVDGGYPGFLPLIKAAMYQHGLSPEQLTGVIVTHHDIDHAGALAEIKAACPHINVYSSGAEASYISGKEKGARLVQAEAMLETMPDSGREGALQFIAMLKSVPPVPVDAVLKDNELLSFLPGVRVVYTPGHTPGHFSLYVQESKILIAADAVVIENGALEIANPQFTLNMQQAIASVKKIAALDIERLICYHGGVMDKDIKNQLNRLLAKYASE